MKKKIVVICLALCAACILLPMTAAAANASKEVTVHSFEELEEQLKCNDGLGLHLIYQGDDLEILRDIVIPDRVRLTVENTSLVVKAHMTIMERVEADTVAVEKGGRLTITSNGRLAAEELVVDGTLTMEDGVVTLEGDLTVNGSMTMDEHTALKLNYPGSSLTGRENIHRERRGDILWNGDITTEQELVDVIEAARTGMKDDRFFIRLEKGSGHELILSRDIEVPQNMQLTVSETMILTVAPECIFTVRGYLVLSGVLNIRGILNNLNEITSDAQIILRDGGTYRGDGDVTVICKPTLAALSKCMPGFDVKLFWKTGDEHRWILTLRDYDEVTGAEERDAAPGELAPVGFSVCDSGAGVLLFWASEGDVERYAVYRSVNGGAYKWLSGPYTNYFTDTDVKSGNTYSYKATCYLPSGAVGEKTDVVEVNYKIGAPNQLAVEYTGEAARLSWAAKNAVGRYAIYRSVNRGPFLWLAGSTATEYTDTTVSDGNVYAYKVACYNPRGVGVGTVSAPVEVLCGVSLPDVPAKPYDIKNVVSGVHVYWKAVDGADKYGVWRSDTGVNGSYKWLGNPTVPHFTDVTVESGKTYFYKVTSVRSSINVHSDKSEAVSIQFLSAPEIILRENTTYSIQIGWNKVEGATSYKIFRKSFYGDDTWKWITDVKSVDSADKEIRIARDNRAHDKYGEVFRYTVRAYNEDTSSGCHNQGRTMVRIREPFLKLDKLGDNAVACSWEKIADANGYEIQVLLDGKVQQTRKITDPETESAAISGLEQGKTYRIRIRAYQTVEGVGTFYSVWNNVHGTWFTL